MATNFQNSNITGIDVDKDSVSEAIKDAKEKGLEKTAFHVHDAADLPSTWADSFDLVIMYDVLHDIPHASKASREFHRILKPGGQLMVVDINVNSDPAKNVGKTNALMVFPFSLYHCMSTSLSVEGSEGLGACAGVEKLGGVLTQGGFTNVESHDLDVNKVAPGLVLFTATKEGGITSPM